MEHNVNYDELVENARTLIRDVPYETANLANLSALLMDRIPALNWLGFYKMVDGALVLGPFQGKPACVRIPVGKGVCGAAVAEGRTLRVADVYAFPGHIACDGASRSEIVVPIWVGGRIWGVLDVDSPFEARFTSADQTGLERVVKVLEEEWSWTPVGRKPSHIREAD